MLPKWLIILPEWLVKIDQLFVFGWMKQHEQIFLVNFCKNLLLSKGWVHPNQKTSATVWISVTRWQIYMFLKWLLTTLIKLAQKQTKFAKVLSKYCLIILNFCQNDEIAPNLVTLGSELTSKYFGGTRQVNFRQVPNGISET